MLTPSMHDVLERMSRARQNGRVKPMHELTPAQARAAYEAGANVLEVPKRELPLVEDFACLSRDKTPISVRLYAPSLEPIEHLLLFFHGGGFVVGSLATHDILCRELAHLSSCAVLAVDYRLAPEAAFPTAFEDAVDAMHWVLKREHPRLASLKQLALGGDSAGGTLTAACAMQARDEGIQLALQLLIYPGCSPDQTENSHQRFATGHVIEGESIAWFFEHYLPDAQARFDWRFAPLMGEAHGLCPAWLALAECDPLVDEGLVFADMLRMAGVSVDLELYKGVTHEFVKMGRMLPEALQFHRDAAAALRRGFGLEV
jgi:acetyl esterase